MHTHIYMNTHTTPPPPHTHLATGARWVPMKVGASEFSASPKSPLFSRHFPTDRHVTCTRPWGSWHLMVRHAAHATYSTHELTLLTLLTRVACSRPWALWHLMARIFFYYIYIFIYFFIFFQTLGLMALDGAYF